MRKKIKKKSTKKTTRKSQTPSRKQILSSTKPKLEEFRFLSGEDSLSRETWRVFRILSEFIKGLDTLYGVTKGVSVFGSARVKPGSPAYKFAEDAGYELGKKGFTVMTGGGPGAMEAANKGARRAGARSVGLGIKLPFEDAMNPFIDLGEEFNFFFVRKVMLVKYAHAFIITPGGLGTLDEMFEALTLIQTGKVSNFPVILMGKDHWAPLIDFLKNTLVSKKMLKEEDFKDFYVTDDPKEAARIVERYWKVYLKEAKAELKAMKAQQTAHWTLE